MTVSSLQISPGPRPGPAQGSDSVGETVAVCRLVNSSGGGQWPVAVPGAGPWQCSSQANRPGPGTVVSGLSSGGQLNIGSGYVAEHFRSSNCFSTSFTFRVRIRVSIRVWVRSRTRV